LRGHQVFVGKPDESHLDPLDAFDRFRVEKGLLAGLCDVLDDLVHEELVGDEGDLVTGEIPFDSIALHGLRRPDRRDPHVGDRLVERPLDRVHDAVVIGDLDHRSRFAGRLVDDILLGDEIGEKLFRYPPDFIIGNVALEQVYIAHTDIPNAGYAEIENVLSGALAAAVDERRPCAHSNASDHSPPLEYGR